jgi:hypothetical protein
MLGFFVLCVSCGSGCCGCCLQVLGLVLWVCLGFSFYGLALDVLMYSPGVLKGALRFYIKFSYLYKKKKKNME